MRLVVGLALVDPVSGELWLFEATSDMPKLRQENHTNPALWPDSDARYAIEENGFLVADEGEDAHP